jgi:hypothetical protein
MYKLIYIQGNGYRCSCCRQTSTEVLDFDTTEEIVEWLTKLEIAKRSKKLHLSDESDWDTDRSVDEIIESKNISLSFDLKLVNDEIEKRKFYKDNTEKREKQEEIERKKNRITNKIKELQDLSRDGVASEIERLESQLSGLLNNG